MDRRHFLQIGAATVIAPFPSFPIEAAPAIEPVPNTITMTISGLVRGDRVAIGVAEDGFIEDVLFNELFDQPSVPHILEVAIPKEYEWQPVLIRVRHLGYYSMEAHVTAIDQSKVYFHRMRDFI